MTARPSDSVAVIVAEMRADPFSAGTLRPWADRLAALEATPATVCVEDQVIDDLAFDIVSEMEDRDRDPFSVRASVTRELIVTVLTPRREQGEGS